MTIKPSRLSGSLLVVGLLLLVLATEDVQAKNKNPRRNKYRQTLRTTRNPSLYRPLNQPQLDIYQKRFGNTKKKIANFMNWMGSYGLSLDSPKPAPGASANPIVPVSSTPGAPVIPKAPPAGNKICGPVKINVTDPKDPTKTLEMEKTDCYPAPPPEAALIVPGGQPDIMRMPGLTSARLPGGSGHKDAHNVAESSFGHYSLVSTLLTLLVAYCLH